MIIDPSIEQESEPEVKLEEEEEPIDEEEVQLDREEDRTFADEMVGMKVKVLYKQGWWEGEIIYFNKALQEYKLVLLMATMTSFPRMILELQMFKWSCKNFKLLS